MTASDIVREAVRYWEPRRLWYNAALGALVAGWLVLTWPHFRPAFTVASLAKLAVLVAIANVCYSAAYVIDPPLQGSPFRAEWQRRRWVLWACGTLFALAMAWYWIADEIYPFVGRG